MPGLEPQRFSRWANAKWVLKFTVNFMCYAWRIRNVYCFTPLLGLFGLDWDLAVMKNYLENAREYDECGFKGILFESMTREQINSNSLYKLVNL